MSADQATPVFDHEAATKVLGDVFAPWVQDLRLVLDRIDLSRPDTAAAD